MTMTTYPSLGVPVREGGRGRTGQDDYVEEVDVKANGEGLALPSYPPLDGDGVGVGEEYNC